MEKLKVWPLAIAVGLSWSFCMVTLGWASSWGWGQELVRVFSSLYIGYAPGFLGGIIGGLWGFGDGFLGGLIIAWVYNKIR